MKAKVVLYQKIAKSIQDQIENQVLKQGDKLPSVRSAQKLYNVSLTTAKKAYLELESRSLIESRPRSGYFVGQLFNKTLPLPTVATLQPKENIQTAENLVDKVFGTISNSEITQFGLSVPGQNFLPIAKLNKGIINAVKNPSLANHLS